MTVSAPLKATQPAQQVQSKPRSNKFKSFAVIVAWQMIALLFVEGVLFWIGMGEEDIYKIDPVIGFKHFPNKRVTWRSEGFSQSYFDSDGLRDPGLTIAKPAGVYRVALLGDSMVEGLQVPIEQTFGKLIEKRVNESGKRQVQVINFGNSGYSTAQEYLQLKDKVFKYQPDLVILGYMSRDMFENWSPPDQTITNVRPYALVLPGQPLVIDSSPITNWMKSPRAKFMRNIDLLRNYSRICGLLSAAETQLSFHDPVYKAIVSLITRPGKTLRQWGSDLKESAKHPPTMQQLASFATPSFSINFFESGTRKREDLVMSSITHAPRTLPGVRFERQAQRRKFERERANAAAHAQALTGAQSAQSAATSDADVVTAKSVASTTVISTAATSTASMASPAVSKSSAITKSVTTRVEGSVGSKAPSDAATAAQANVKSTANIDVSKAVEGNAEYVQLMTRTMRELLVAMQRECAGHSAKLAVFILPCRAQLSPTPGMETKFFNIAYHDEINIIDGICRVEQIPMFNGEAAAEQVPAADRPSMFYLMHMNAKGHEFIAEKMQPFVAGLALK